MKRIYIVLYNFYIDLLFFTNITSVCCMYTSSGYMLPQFCLVINAITLITALFFLVKHKRISSYDIYSILMPVYLELEWVIIWWSRFITTINMSYIRIICILLSISLTGLFFIRITKYCKTKKLIIP